MHTETHNELCQLPLGTLYRRLAAAQRLATAWLVQYGMTFPVHSPVLDGQALGFYVRWALDASAIREAITAVERRRASEATDRWHASDGYSAEPVDECSWAAYQAEEHEGRG